MLEAQFELDVGGQLGRGKLIFMSDHQSTLMSEFSHLQHSVGGRCSLVNTNCCPSTQKINVDVFYLLFAVQTQYFYFPPLSRESNSYCQMKTPQFPFLGKIIIIFEEKRGLASGYKISSSILLLSCDLTAQLIFMGFLGTYIYWIFGIGVDPPHPFGTQSQKSFCSDPS